MDDQWDDMMGFGKHYGKTHRKMCRDDQQYYECINSVDWPNKGLTKFHKFLRRVEEKIREDMRRKLEKREEKIWLTELSRATTAKEQTQQKARNLELVPLREKVAHSKSNERPNINKI